MFNLPCINSKEYCQKCFLFNNDKQSKKYKQGQFSEQPVEYIDDDFEIPNYNLRRLSDEQQTIAFFFNHNKQDVYNCAEGNKLFYKQNAQIIQANVEEKKEMIVFQHFMQDNQINNMNLGNKNYVLYIIKKIKLVILALDLIILYYQELMQNVMMMIK